MSQYGRYEMVNRSTNTNKFWWVVFDQSLQKVICTWGRIGNSSPEPKIYTILRKQKRKSNKS